MLSVQFTVSEYLLDIFKLFLEDIFLITRIVDYQMSGLSLMNGTHFP